MTDARFADALDRAADSIAPAPNEFVTRYFDDPARFARECIDWGDDGGLAPYQERALRDLVRHKRLGLRAPHGTGKSCVASVAVLWFALTRDAAGRDWKIPTTASAWRQLSHFLWPEVAKWARRIRWDVVGRAPFDARTELLTLQLKLAHGAAFAVASDDPASLEGAHASSLLFVYDEAKAVPAGTFDATEGAFSGGGNDSGSEAFALAISTPATPTGRFYEICSRKPGLEDWHASRVTLDEAVAAGRIAPSWVEARARQWGRTSAVFLNRVLAEFATSDEDGVVALAYVEAAIERWRVLHPDCTAERHVASCSPGELTAVGVDVARSGADSTVLALRHGDAVTELRRHRHAVTTETTGFVKGVLDAYGGRAVVDVIGIGAGVVDQLREDRRFAKSVVAFNASEGTAEKDKSGELGFVNLRAAAWWRLRELLEPDSDADIALPDDDELIGDLVAPRWKVTSGGKIQIESKDEIRKRLGRSPDVGDAVVMALWEKRRGRGLTPQQQDAMAEAVRMNAMDLWRPNEFREIYRTVNDYGGSMPLSSPWRID